jgi:4,5-DOPA dioxygenase extradiol
MPERMPTLFMGHGSPMNAIEENEFTHGWEEIARSIPRPESIICVSAHWFVPSTMVTSVQQPRTIHDFYGFPSELYQQQYPAPGAPELATEVSAFLADYSIGLDSVWGLDHGTWSILKRMYPEANIPTIQLSIDYTKPPRYHFELGSRLESLRNQGVLIIGSGNLVHNLGAVAWHSMESEYGWAREFETAIREAVFDGDSSVFVDFENLGSIARKAHPSLDHYLPLLYTAGAAGSDHKPQIFNQRIILGSISMTCFRFG